jgi:small subunit ribosomal protein S6
MVQKMYETTFILTPELTEDEYKTAVAKFLKILTDQGAEILNTEYWGMKKLAYLIQKKGSGYYTYIEFKAPVESIAKLETEYGYDERVLRYLTVVLDKHAVAYNTKRREQGFGSEKKSAPVQNA